MRIVVLEYLTAGGWREIAASAGAVAEGRLMLQAVLRDLRDIDGVDRIVALDPDVISDAPLGASAAPVAAHDLRGSWAAIAAGADVVWPIAPETGGILERMVETAWRAGPHILASGHGALAIARSKTATSAWLAARGIPVVATAPLATPPRAAAGWVVKPDDGAGAVGTCFIADRDAFRRLATRAGEARVVQPFLRGEALSLSMFADDGQAWLLACNRQIVSMSSDGIFTYRGSLVGGAEARRAALEPLAQRIAAALPELWGYIGVDLIDGEDGPVVLEINPRLTTSYVGLAESIGLNPARLLLALRTRPLRSIMCPLEARPVLVEVPLG